MWPPLVAMVMYINITENKAHFAPLIRPRKILQETQDSTGKYNTEEVIDRELFAINCKQNPQNCTLSDSCK